MINFTDKKNLPKLLELEKSSLIATLDIQKNLNKQILTFMKNFIGNINIEVDFNNENKTYDYMDKSTKTLNLSNTNISSINTLISNLDNIKNNISLFSNYKTEEKVKEYNQIFQEKMNLIYPNTVDIQKFIHEISLLDLSEFVTNQNPVPETSEENDKTSEITISSQELDTSFIENTLIISELQGKVILPYDLKKVKEILLDNNDKYKTLEDVIQNCYTKSIKNYRFFPMARFREAYKLIVEREKSSKFKALSLAAELLVNYNLHPAIITACKTLDELDIYLACLEDNTLEDFKFFNIKYEIAPTVLPQEKGI